MKRDGNEVIANTLGLVIVILLLLSVGYSIGKTTTIQSNEVKNMTQGNFTAGYIYHNNLMLYELQNKSYAELYYVNSTNHTNIIYVVQYTGGQKWQSQ